MARATALAAIACFVPVIYTFATGPAFWADYPGILFHLFIFVLVSRLPAPEWVKMAGYGWLVIDTVVGAMTLNGVGHDIFMPMRLGGHIFAGIWIVGTSLRGAPVMKWVGLVTGVWLSGYTFIAPFAPMEVLYPASMLVVVWLGIVAYLGGNGRA